jgi:thioredoxin 1
MKSINEFSFSADVLESKIPVIVKFEAKWCAPCKAMKPVLDAVAKEYEGKVAFVTANVDEVPLVAQRVRIAQIPALVLFEGGQVKATKTGASIRSQIIDWIDTALPGARSS